MEEVLTAYGLILGGIGCIVALALLGASIFCFVRYSRTRKRAYLVAGILLSLIIPGILICIVLGMFIPSTTVVYGPPPPTMVVYGPPSDLAP
jgi:hypothetical protein